MRNFGMALFGGYKRDEVDQYIENLIDGLEELKEEQEGSVQQLQEEMEQLRQQIARQEQELQEKELQLSAGEEERQQLKDQVKQLKEQPEEDPRTAEEMKELQKKVREYEDRYDSVNRVLSLAEKTVRDAQVEAAGIVTSGKSEVDEYRTRAEHDLEKTRKKNEDDFMLAKYKLMNYLKALNDTQNKLVATYHELGELVDKLPLRIGDIFSEEPFDLLENESFNRKETAKDEASMDFPENEIK